MVELLRRISFEPAVCHGKAHIRGTRVVIAAILDSLASGATEDKILEEYPSLEKEDIRAAMAYAAVLAREQLVA